MTEVSVRRAGPHDMAGLLDLYRHLYRGDEVTLEPAHAAEQWSQLLASDCARVLVAEHHTALVGTCGVAIVPSMAHGCRPFAVIEHVVTHPYHRRKGVGSALLKAALDAAWAERCYKVTVATGSRRPGVLRFYARAGFPRSHKTLFEIRRD